jgi:hypothetical protein
MNELKNCDVSDLLIAVVDGLKGFPSAITAVLILRQQMPAQDRELARNGDSVGDLMAARGL